MKQEMVILSGWASQTLILQELLESLSQDFNITVVQYNNISNFNDIYEVSYEAIKGKENIKLVGWSLGGLVALKLILLYDNFESVSIIGGFSRFTLDKDNCYGIRRDYVESMIRGLRKNPQIIMKKFYKNMGIDANSLLYKKLLDDIKNIDIKALIEGLEYLLYEDIGSILSEIDIPVNLIHCKDDKIVSYKSTEEIHSEIINSRMFIFKTGGHAPFIENIQEIRDIIMGQN